MLKETPANNSDQHYQSFKPLARQSSDYQNFDYDIKYFDSKIDAQVVDKSTADKIGQTSEEFIKYLDTYFKPEINLTENKIQLFSFTQNKRELKSKVKLTYRGNKCTTDKGRHSERRDVLYKTFIRTIRRYLCNVFEDEFRDFSKIKKNDSDLFKRNVTAFYDKYFKECATFQMNASENEHEYFCYILGVLITSKVSFTSKTDEMKKQLYLYRAMLKKFCSSLYPQFFLSKLIPEFFKLMKNSGAILKCIEAYPKLNQSKDAYFQIVDSIIDFKVNPFLLK